MPGSSSIDLLKMVKNGLLSGGKSIAIKGAKWAVGKGLNAAFGWENAETKRQNWAKETLTSILDELSVISDDLNEVKADVKDLQDFTKETAFIQQYIDLESDFNKYAGDVQTIYDLYYELSLRLSKAAQAGSSNEALASIDPKPSVMTIVGMENDLLKAIEHMEATLMNEDLIYKGEGRNMMQAWTDASIVQMNDGNGTALEWYMALEYKMKKALEPLMVGYMLRVNILNYDNPALNEEVDVAGLGYYTSHIERKMKAIIENYQQCVERLVLSTYHPELKGEDTTFVKNKDFQTILSRSSLMSWLVLSFNTLEVNPGIVSTCFTRSSLLTDNGASGPVLQPNSSFEASGGLLVDIDPYYNSNSHHMNYWYRCIDSVTLALKNYTETIEILPFESSYIRAIRYQWDADASTVQIGTAVASSGYFSKAKAEYYSKSTFDLATAEEAKIDSETGYPLNAVLMAHRADATDILLNQLQDVAQPKDQSGWTFDKAALKLDKVGETKGVLTSATVRNRFNDHTPYYGETVLGLTCVSHDSDHDRIAQIRTLLRYSGTSEQKALLVCDSDYTAKVQGFNPNGKDRMAKGHIHLTARHSYPEDLNKGEKSLPKKYKLMDDKEVKSGKSYTNKAIEVKPMYEVQMIPGVTTQFQWEMRFHIKAGLDTPTTGTVATPTNAVIRELQAKFNIETFRMAWPSPKMLLT